jgi:uncharacterized protein (TIGR02147 family)
MPDSHARGGKKSKPAVAKGISVPQAELNIFEYSDYREYLKDYYHVRKGQPGGFSLRTFARKAKFPSHTHLQYVMDGKRNLSQKTLVKLILALELATDQARFFQSLVFFNQAKSSEEKTFHHTRLLEEDPRRTLKSLEGAQFQLFGQWYHSAILEMVSLKDFHGQAKWIASHLVPSITPAQAEESLRLLLEAGFLRRSINGFVPMDPAITTGDEVLSQLVRSYHLEMMRLATRAMDDLPAEDRDISAVCFAIKAGDFSKVKRQIQQMRKQLRSFAAAPGEGNKVIQINMQLFPLSRA